MEFFKIFLYSIGLVILTLTNAAAKAFDQTSPVCLNRLSYGLQIFPTAKIP